MTLQDQIDAFQKLIFSHFRGGTNNECRIAALVPLVQESYGIYKFITSMLRAMHTSQSTYRSFGDVTDHNQLPATTRRWSPSVLDTMASITVWSNFTTNVRIFDISQVSLLFRNFLKNHQTYCPKTMSDLRCRKDQPKK
jgi:hypothetical protein